MNLPNKVTGIRFLIAIGYFVVLAAARGATGEDRFLLVDIGVGMFLVAAISDILDGYLARKYGEETSFGRMADPFVDKILVCGSFILLLSFRELDDILSAWMVVVIVAREFVVHSIRTMLETRRRPFGANFWGKQKMILQCVAIVSALLYISRLSSESWALALTTAILWVMLVSTVVSGMIYLGKARSLMDEGETES